MKIWRSSRIRAQLPTPNSGPILCTGPEELTDVAGVR